MPIILYEGRAIHCEPGENLRDVLLREGLSPHNEGARWLNCRGLGSCGTCAIKVKGALPPLTRMERWRLSFPPHVPEHGLRLACQLRVLGDLELSKGSGFWGQYLPPDPDQSSSG
jgi:ferredoxin